jgi:exodeoxyribonuclease VII large subunit
VTSLFDGLPASAPEPATFSVTELGLAIDAALREGFGEVWVRGEVAGLRAGGRGHLYFELCDTGEEGAGGKLPVALYAGQARVVERQLAHAGLAIGNGVELRIRAAVGFYPPHGKLQLRMVAVDPAFTVGQLALSRERLLAALRADGTLAAQQALGMPAVPLRVGLLTSRGSAAHHDVEHQLAAAGCAFDVVLADAQVQGDGAVASVVAALRNLYRVHRQRPFDLVAIVRGGGARTDLMTFDDGGIARAIAKMPMPVWTGIGHEIDRSVADHAAHTAFPTPTAVGAALRTRAREAVTDLDRRRQRLRTATSLLLAGEQDRLEAARRRLERAHDAAVAVAGSQLTDRRRRLRTGVNAALAAERARLDLAAARLPRVVTRAVQVETAHLAVAARQLDALDPARVLARGFSVTRRADGRPVTDAGHLVADEVLVTQLAVGSVTSRVVDGRLTP